MLSPSREPLKAACLVKLSLIIKQIKLFYIKILVLTSFAEISNKSKLALTVAVNRITHAQCSAIFRAMAALLLAAKPERSSRAF
jgi:hypothetical protein